MPSPVGHGLAALAAGWAVGGTGGTQASQWRVRQAMLLVAIGIAPDLDLLVGRHSMETHSLGAAVAVASLAAWQRWPVASSRTTIWIAVALAWLTHPLADALGADTSFPHGVLALWPVSSDYFHTGWDVFGPISRRYWRDDFLWINLVSVIRELVILVPVVALVWWRRRPDAV